MSRVLRYLGFAEELEFMETPAPEAELAVDIASSGLDAPSDSQILYDGGLSRARYHHRPGFYAPSGNIVYAWDIRTIGWFLKWALSGYDFALGGGSGGNNLHNIYGAEDVLMQSFCARLGKDIFEHIFSGCAINSLNLETSNEYCMATAEVIAGKDASGEIKEITAVKALLPDEYPLAFHELTMQIIGGNDISAKVKSANLSISNNIADDAGRSVGSRYPRRAVGGARDVTLDLTLYYDSKEMLEKLWGDTSGPSALGSDEYGVRLTFDSGTSGSLVIDLPTVINTDVQQQPSGRDPIEQSVSCQAFIGDVTIGGETAATEIYCKLENNEEEMSVEGS